MLVCCSIISVIVLLALFGTILVTIFQAIVNKIERTAWTKTLVNLPLQELEDRLRVLEKHKSIALFGYLEKSESQKQQVSSKLSDTHDRIRILERLISERQGLESGKR